LKLNYSGEAARRIDMVDMQQAIVTIRALREALVQWPEAAANGQRTQPEEAIDALDMSYDFLTAAGEEPK
jgi:hypothetical protein